MDIAFWNVEPGLPIFVVEVIDADGYACLYADLHLHEAVRISAAFELEAPPGREPRIFIPEALLALGLTEE